MDEILKFIHDSGTAATDIPAMERDLHYAISYEQRVGEALNQAVMDYKLFYAAKLEELGRMEDETETTRKAKLEAWTSEKKRTVDDLKQIKGSLKSIRMALHTSIKNRREER